MKLRIAREYKNATIDGVYTLATSYMQMKSTHLFIASNKWEEIYIELDDSMQTGYLQYLHLVCPRILVSLPEVITEQTILLLAEIFPDKRGLLRKNFLLHKDIKEVLGACLVQSPEKKS